MTLIRHDRCLIFYSACSSYKSKRQSWATRSTVPQRRPCYWVPMQYRPNMATTTRTNTKTDVSQTTACYLRGTVTVLRRFEWFSRVVHAVVDSRYHFMHVHACCCILLNVLVIVKYASHSSSSSSCIIWSTCLTTCTLLYVVTCTIAVGFLIDSLLGLLTYDVRSMLKNGTWHCTRDLCLAEYWTSTRWTRISGRSEWSRGGRNTRVCSGNVMRQHVVLLT